MYSMIQFTSIIMLYFKGSVFGNWSASRSFGSGCARTSAEQ